MPNSERAPTFSPILIDESDDGPHSIATTPATEEHFHETTAHESNPQGFPPPGGEPRSSELAQPLRPPTARRGTRDGPGAAPHRTSPGVGREPAVPTAGRVVRRHGRPHVSQRYFPDRGQPERDDADAPERQRVELREALPLHGRRRGLCPAPGGQPGAHERRQGPQRPDRGHGERQRLRPRRKQPDRGPAAQRRPLAGQLHRPGERHHARPLPGRETPTASFRRSASPARPSSTRPRRRSTSSAR